MKERSRHNPEQNPTEFLPSLPPDIGGDVSTHLGWEFPIDSGEIEQSEPILEEPELKIDAETAMEPRQQSRKDLALPELDDDLADLVNNELGWKYPSTTNKS